MKDVTLTYAAHTAYLDPMTGYGLLVLPHEAQAGRDRRLPTPEEMEAARRFVAENPPPSLSDAQVTTIRAALWGEGRVTRDAR